MKFLVIRPMMNRKQVNGILPRSTLDHKVTARCMSYEEPGEVLRWSP